MYHRFNLGIVVFILLESSMLTADIWAHISEKTACADDPFEDWKRHYT